MRFRWGMVCVAVLGLVCGPGPVNIFAFTEFLKPMAQDLGVSRELLTFALFTTTTTGAIMNPFFGWGIDRFGTRAMLATLVPLFAFGVFCYSLMSPSPVSIFLTFGLVGLAGSVCGPTPYAALVARWFDGERGLALGIAMAGVGLGAALVPPFCAVLITHFGWRWGYRGLAMGIVLLAWLPAFFVRDPEPSDLMRLSDARPDGTLAGVLLRQAVAQWRFWVLTAAFFLGVVAINGVVAHTVPMLTDRGISLTLATAAISISGLCIIVGRILSGWCLDRFSGRMVAVGFFLLPMLGIVLLAEGGGTLVPIVGAALCGLTVGAEIDLMAFFVSRYFGIRAYGRVYGLMFSLFAAGNGVGPALGGISIHRLHSYGPALLLFELCLLATCLLFLPLGPYPYPAPRRGAFGPRALAA